MAAFINSERKWDDVIARFLGEAIDQAFPNADLPPSISNIHLTYEDEEGEEHRWDADTNTWSPAMPAT